MRMLDKINREIELLQRHMKVLNAVIEYGPIGIVKLMEILHDSHHHIRYSLRILEHHDYINATSAGAVPTLKAMEMINNFDCALDELIKKLLSIRMNK